MFYTIYKVTNKVNGKIYIGVHKTKDVNDGYMGSGKVLQYAQEKYGIENFEKEILVIFDNSEEMFQMESILVNADFIKRDDNYNLKEGGSGGWDFINENIPFEGRGVHYANENGLNNNVGQCYKGGKALQLRLKNDEQFRKEYIQKLKDNNVRPFLGRKHSEETKEKMRESAKGKHKGKRNSQYGTIWVHSLKEKRSKKIKKEDLSLWESKGWLKGRKMKFF